MKKFLFVLIILVLAGGYFWYRGATQPLDTLGQNIQGLMSGEQIQGALSGLSQSGAGMITTAKDKILQIVQQLKDKTTTTPPPSDTTMCTMDYRPVCGEVQVQCIKAPCPPIKQTFGNQCALDANKLAKFLYEGECTQETTVDLSTCSSYFDGCNTCSIKDGKIAGCTKKYCQTPETPKCLQNTTQIANPASVNCEQQGGNLKIQTSKDGSQLGMCIFPEGNQCEEWALYRGECSK